MESNREIKGLAVDVPDARYQGQRPICWQRHPQPKLETENYTNQLNNEQIIKQKNGKEKKNLEGPLELLGLPLWYVQVHTK